MRSLIIFRLCSLMVVLLSTLPVKAQRQVNFCNLKGSVYFTKNRAGADFKIFVESNETFADFTVFITSSPAFADEPGLWCEVSSPAFADFSVYVEPNRTSADFAVFFTKTQTFAGCNK